MKKILSCIFAVILFSVTSIPVFAAESVDIMNPSITPYAYGTYDGTMEVTLSIPQYTSVLDYTVAAWNCPIDIKYRINYNLNTGEITSVTYLSTEIVPGTAMSPTEQARLVSLNYESATMSIVNNRNSIKCNYSATADLIYVQFPGFPANQENVSFSVRGSSTVSPPRP